MKKINLSVFNLSTQDDCICRKHPFRFFGWQLFLLSMLLFSGSEMIFPQTVAPGIWESSGPLIDVSVQIVLENPNNTDIIYAGTVNRGVFRSTNGGRSWGQANPPMHNSTVHQLAYINGYLYASISPGAELVESSTAVPPLLRSNDGLNWTAVNGLPSVLSTTSKAHIAAIGDTLYVGGENARIYRSNDNGASVIAIFDGEGNSPITAIKRWQGTIYASTAGAGIFYSADGISWNSVPSLAEINVKKLLATSNRLFATTGISGDAANAGGKGIFYSDDGTTWQQTIAPMDDKIVNDILLQNDTLYAATNILENPDDNEETPLGIFWSSDNGETWQQFGPPMDDTFIMTLYHSSNTLYAGSEGDGMFLKPGGSNWRQANPPLDDETVLMIRAISNGVFAATDIGLLYSIDAGTNWVLRNVISPAVTTGYYIDDSRILSYGRDGVQRSVDGSSSWIRALDPLDKKVVTSFIEKNGAVYAATAFDEGFDDGIFQSFDGLNWTEVNFPDSLEVLMMAEQGGGMFAGARKKGGDYATNLFRSEDGVNWGMANIPGITDPDIESFFSLGDTLFARVQNGDTRELHFKAGSSPWVRSNIPQDSGRVVALIFGNDMYYAARSGTNPSGGSAIFRSSDGINWERTLFPANVSPQSLTNTNETFYAGTARDGSSQMAASIYYSDDGWEWHPATVGGTAQVVSTFITIDGITYAGTSNEGKIFRTIDKGRHWTPLNTGLDDIRSVYSLGAYQFPDVNRFFAATSGGLYFQTIDLDPPQTLSLSIGGQQRFTATRNISLLLAADGADSMSIAEDSLFTNSGWLAYQTASSFQLSGEAGKKNIYAKFKDVSANESNVLNTSILLDDEPPAFLPHNIPSGAIAGQEVVISQKVNDVNLAQMELSFWRAGDEAPFITAFDDSIARIDGILVGSQGLDYRITASDSAGNDTTLQNGDLDFFSLPVNLAAGDLGDSPLIPGGFNGEAYRIISMPMNVSGSAATAAGFLGDLGTYGQKGDWRFYRYQGGNQWSEGAGLELASGEAYFILIRQSRNLTNRQSGETMPTSAGINGTVPGWQLSGNDWTLIGNPYNAELELSQLKLKRLGNRLSENVTGLQIWQYDGEWIKAGADNPEITLLPWTGLFIRVQEADTIVFANPDDPFNDDFEEKKPGGKAGVITNTNDWQMQIIAESAGFTDKINYLGVQASAKDNLDVNDWHELPLLPGGITVRFPHPEWELPANLSADIRSPGKDGYRWQLEVGSQRNSPVSLSFQGIETVPAEFQIILVDETTQIARDLRNQSLLEISLPSNGNTKELILLVGNEGFVNANINDLDLLPAFFDLRPNYPNPFNPTTTIRYALPVSGKVTLQIFDVLGRKISTVLDNALRQPGFYESVLDLRMFASGVYFYRIQIDGERNFQKTRKMLLVK